MHVRGDLRTPATEDTVLSGGPDPCADAFGHANRDAHSLAQRQADPEPKPKPVVLKPLLTSYRGLTCHYLWMLPKGTRLLHVRHSGPVYTDGGKTVWRLVLTGRVVVLADPTSPDSGDQFQLEDHPNRYLANGDRGFYTLVQRSPSDRHRLGVWKCG